VQGDGNTPNVTEEDEAAIREAFEGIMAQS
jgi:hypothetical protein